MITPAPLFMFAVILCCLPLDISGRITSLTIDDHACAPEKIKYQNRYICDSEGNVECLTGWKRDTYDVDKHFPCAVPICDQLCKNGECKLPNVCSCEVGWSGPDCGNCIAMPGCVNGGCVDPDTMESEPFTCFCEEGWKGALCDIPDCLDHCSNQGQCVVTSGGEHQCNCNLGWTGDTCATCIANVGCNTTHTITDLGCQKVDPMMAGTFIDVPNSCQCTDDWTGPFCDLPNCLDDQDGPIECVHGVCTAGGIDSTTDDLIPAFCQCDVGWEGEKCDECVAHPMCPNDGSGAIAKCINPYDCRCEGSEDEKTDSNDFKFCTDFIATGACKEDVDCAGEEMVCTDGACASATQPGSFAGLGSLHLQVGPGPSSKVLPPAHFRG